MPLTILKRLKGQPTNQRDDASRTIVWVMTTGTTDRDGETVDPEGGDFSEYQQNPTVQWNHDTDSEPIGHLVGLPWNEPVGQGTKYPEILGPKRMALLGRVKFDSDERSNRIYKKVLERLASGGSMGGSISFVPEGRTEKNGDGGNHYPSWKLLEFTLCSVGSNPDSVATNKKSLKTTSTVIKLGRAKGVTIKLKGGHDVAKKKKFWIKGKTAWIKRKDFNDETKDYLEMRGLDEVRVEEAAPDEDGWVEQAMDGQAPQAPEMKGFESDPKTHELIQSLIQRQQYEGTGQGASHFAAGTDLARQIASANGVSTGQVLSYAIKEAGKQRKDIGPSPPTTESVAEDVATRAAELEPAVGAEPAVEAAMEERALPKSLRPAVKALAMKRLGKNKSYGFDRGVADAKAGKPPDSTFTLTGGKVADDYLAGYNSVKGGKSAGKKKVVPGRVCRNKKTGQVVLVKSVKGKTATVVKADGDEEEMKAKELKRKGNWPTAASSTALTNWQGDGKSDLTDWQGGVGVAEAVKSWYKDFASKGLQMPALKDADLTGEEQKDVEDAVDEAFMKAADELGLEDKDIDPGNFRQNDAAFARMREDGELEDYKSFHHKAADSLVPQEDANTETPKGEGIAPETGPVGTDATGTDPSTVPQGKTALPRKQFKAWLKGYCAKAASKSALKLRSTVAKRLKRLLTKAQPSADISPDKACQVLKDGEVNGQPLTSAQRGMFGAACAQAHKKLRKKLGKHPKCSKCVACKKCCKKLAAKHKAPVGGVTDGDSPQEVLDAAAISANVRQNGDGQYEVWMPSTGEVLAGPFSSADLAADAIVGKLSKALSQPGAWVVRGPNSRGQYSIYNTVSTEVMGPYSSREDAEKKVQVMNRGKSKTTSGGTMDAGPIPSDDGITGNPTGGGTMEMKSKADDDDPDEKRIKQLLQRKAEDDISDEDLDKVLKAMQDAAEEQKQMKKAIFRMTLAKV